MFRKRRDRGSGFLLIELLAATVLLSTALVAISRAFSNSAALLNHAAFMLRGGMLLEGKMAELEAGGELPVGKTEGGFPEGGPFQWSVAVEQRPEPSLYEVMVRVSWKEGRRPHSLTVTTLLEKPTETEETERIHTP